jgi:hypothetical protein
MAPLVELPAILPLWSALSYFAIYCATYRCFPRLPHAQCVDARSRIPSFVNVAVCLFACVALREELCSTFWDPYKAAFDSSGSRDAYLHLVAGYMLHDMCLMALEPSIRDWTMFAHHIVVIIALEAGCYFQVEWSSRLYILRP